MIRLGSDRRHKYGIETNSSEVDVLSSANLLAAEHMSSELTLHDCHSVTELHSKIWSLWKEFQLWSHHARECSADTRQWDIIHCRYHLIVDALLFTLIYSCFFSDKQLMTAPQCYLTQPELTSRHPRYRSSLAHLVCSCSAAYGSTCLDHPHLYCTCIRGDSTSNGVQDFIWHSLRRSSSDGCPVGAALLSTIHSYSMQSVGPPKRW